LLAEGALPSPQAVWNFTLVKIRLWRWGAQPPPTADFIRSAVGVPVTRGHAGGEIDPEDIVGTVMSAFVEDGAL
jgi:hypothetical protein